MQRRMESATTGSTHSSLWSGDSPIEMLVVGFQERDRLKVMEELRSFITVDNHEAVEIGDLHKNTDSRPLVRFRFTANVLAAVVREGEDELTLRRRKYVLVFTLLSVVLPIVAACFPVLPSRMRRHSMERVVMGDMYRYHD